MEQYIFHTHLYIRIRHLTINSLPKQTSRLLYHPHKGHLTSKLNSKKVPVLSSLDPFLIFPFHLLPSPVHPTEFSFCFFPDFLSIVILLSSNNNKEKLTLAVREISISRHNGGLIGGPSKPLGQIGRQASTDILIGK